MRDDGGWAPVPTICCCVNPRYWAFDWLDAAKIDSETDLTRALASTSVIEELRSVAFLKKSECRAPVDAGRTTLLAARGIDLSGDLDCWHWECRLRQVNELLSRVWLYFGRVVVEDWLTR